MLYSGSGRVTIAHSYIFPKYFPPMWRRMAPWARGSKSDLTGLPNIGIRHWRKLTPLAESTFLQGLPDLLNGPVLACFDHAHS